MKFTDEEINQFLSKKLSEFEPAIIKDIEETVKICGEHNLSFGKIEQKETP